TEGFLAAKSFRNTFERMGGKVIYFFQKDFKARGYDVSDFTKVFTKDELLRDSLGYKNVQAIYLPFTGESSQSMIELVLTDLEAYNSNLTILGSQEWLYADLAPERINK